MHKTTQRDENPYPYSDSNKRYQTFDYYTRVRFGGKCAKVTLDIGCTCPNKADGRGGCVYCKNGSRSAVGETIRAQYENGLAVANRKWHVAGVIPYFQSGTNTYGEIDVLRRSFLAAAALPGAVMIGIGTRADCLGDEVLALLRELALRIPVTVELGLQTVHDDTARRIRRGHDYAAFVAGYRRLRALAEELSPGAPKGCGRLSIGIHLINGLPGEDESMMLETARSVAALAPDLVKIHLLHVLTDTPLADWYNSGAYIPLTRDAYTRVTAAQLTLLPPDTIIGRVTGDAPAADLLAPAWSRRKTEVSNMIDKLLYANGEYQGCHYGGDERDGCRSLANQTRSAAHERSPDTKDETI